MKHTWGIAVALWAVFVMGCQRESRQPPDQTTTPVSALPQEVFHEVVEGFLGGCLSEAQPRHADGLGGERL